jgi:hypothetical protein
VPGNVSSVNQDGQVLSVVTKALEEDAPAKQRYLQRLYVDIDAVCSPGIGAYDVGDEGAEQAIEVGEEEDRAGESVEEEA